MCPHFSIIVFCVMSVSFRFYFVLIFPTTFVGFAVYFPTMLQILLLLQNFTSYSSCFFLYNFPFFPKCHKFCFNFSSVLLFLFVLLSFSFNTILIVSTALYILSSFALLSRYLSFRFSAIFYALFFFSSCFSVVSQELITLFLSCSATASLKFSFFFDICSFILSTFSVLLLHSPSFLLLSQ